MKMMAKRGSSGRVPGVEKLDLRGASEVESTELEEVESTELEDNCR